MGLDDLPEPIKREILRCVNDGDYTPLPCTFGVTELLYCLRRSYFKRVKPKPISNLKSAVHLYRGSVFDKLWTPLFKRNQVRCTYRCRNIPVSITGKFDFLTEDGIVTDLKTPKTLYYINEPSEEYKKQVRFYAYCNAINKAQICYFDGSDCKVFQVEVGDCTGLLEELEGKAMMLWTSFHNGHLPPPSKLKWLCNSCEYYDECKGDLKR